MTVVGCDDFEFDLESGLVRDGGGDLGVEGVGVESVVDWPGFNGRDVKASGAEMALMTPPKAL